MVFFVNVAPDIYCTKHNVKLEFPIIPTLGELTTATEEHYEVRMRSARPAGFPEVEFSVQVFQVFDEVLRRWIDLSSSAQLTNGCQVYAFQPESNWTIDVQNAIPLPSSCCGVATAVGSPRRARLAADQGVAPLLSEKLRSVFFDLDIGNKGYVLYSDLRGAFIRNDISFSYSTIGELFDEADANRDGHITYEEWIPFAVKYPSIIDALFFHNRGLQLVRTRDTTSSTSFSGTSSRSASAASSIASGASGVTDSPSRQRVAQLQQELAESTARVEATRRNLNNARIVAEAEEAQARADAAAERARLEREYEAAKISAELARTRAAQANLRELQLRNQMTEAFSPSRISPAH